MVYNTKCIVILFLEVNKMKKIIALVLSVVLLCCFAVTAFAAESPVAEEKVTITIKKAETTETVKLDTAYSFSVGEVIILKADAKFGAFNSWSIYKTVDSKQVAAVEGVDFEIVKGSLTANEITIKLKSTSVIACGNYNNTTTDPSPEVPSVDTSASAPQTGDMTIAYALVVMFAFAALVFGAKKVYSK